MRRLFGVGLVLLMLGAVSPLGAQGPGPKPTVWMGPPAFDQGKCFRALFEHPDQWQETRRVIDVLFYSDLNLKKHFSDEELRAWFAQVRQWRLKFAMEVGAVKPWGLTGEKTFDAERPNWERIERLGGNVYAIGMDEPLLCCRLHIHKSDDYAVQETANYIALVRKHFPRLLIGDIEPYPSIPVADHVWWIDALGKRLAKMKVRGLDFYRLDVNWANFVGQNHGSWLDVRKVERECRKRGLPFSLIYWASSYPSMKRLGLADDSTWYVEIMQQAYDYALVQGAPDQYVIESWIDAPSRSVPETDPWTFTRSVLDLSRRFVRRGP